MNGTHFRNSARLLFLSLALLLFSLSGCNQNGPSHSAGSDVGPALAGKVNDFTQGAPITGITESFLEISYYLPPGEMELLSTEPGTTPFWVRRNISAYGLSQFCPTVSYIFPSEEGEPSFLDVHVRKKGGTLHENYAELSYFASEDYGNPIFPRESGKQLCIGTETTETYESAQDFYEKNFSAAEAGQDKSSFTRLENTEIDGAETYHYCYTNPVEPGAEKRDGESDVLIPYERYGEHYLFETENYIYLFAFSGAEKDDACLTYFQKVIDSIQVDAESSYNVPIWKTADWLETNIRYTVEDLRDCDLTGSMPESIQNMVHQLPQ